MRVLPYGEAAVLVETDEPLQLMARLHRCSRRGGPDARSGLLELVPAARTLLVRFDPAIVSAATLTALVSGHPDGRVGTGPRPPAVPGDHSRRVSIEVTYDGTDLADVAARSSLDPDEVVRRHSSTDYTVAFCGFSPGFAYLTGLDPALHLPRLASPRTSVPAGSVAIAGEYTGVYPRSSPGGWLLLGRTDAPLWDTSRPDPALLTPGTQVRFVPC